MTNIISFKDALEGSNSTGSKYIIFPFYADGNPLASDSEKHARWGMTLLSAGSMRFRWNELNEKREMTLRGILNELKKPVCTGNCSSNGTSNQGKCDCKLKAVPIELIHSKIVVEAKEAEDTKKLTGDGIITQNPLLVPTVTVADCVPIFLYDKKTKVFGAFHSGWKGTGIAGTGVERFAELYGSKPDDILAAIGPHIGECCYNVDEERAEYFTENFGENCISKASDASQKTEFPFRLSLTEANLFVLKKAGIREENIIVAKDCTCCTKFSSGENVFGSFRRQAAFLPKEVDADTRSRSMTVQAAFVFRG